MPKLLLKDFGLTPVVATEIEFYLHDAGEPSVVLENIRKVAAEAGIELASAEQERGAGQYEVALTPSANAAKIIADTERFKALIGGDFSAKPLKDAPGSGLHVHVHLEDASGKNIFFREGEEFSPELLHAIGGLLEYMNPFMHVFAPTAESYARFAAGSNAPTTVSWGTNNRTVAVRLPTKPMNHKHIEHRVAGADADVRKVVGAILAGIHHGLKMKCNPGEPIYGDASLPQYNLPKLAMSMEEAQEYKK